MADFSGRTEAEARLAKRLAAVGQQVYQDVVELLGDPPDILQLTESVWLGIETRYTGAIRPELEAIFLDALNELAEEIGFTLSWDAANQAAADWARQYTFDLVKGINDSSRKMLQQAVSDFFEQGLSIDDLRDKLSAIFGPVRAEMIAVTEVTRAVVEGEKTLIRGLEAEGVMMQSVFNTSNDNRVCPICSPLNQQVVTEDQHPPRHIRCRCWLSWRPLNA